MTEQPTFRLIGRFTSERQALAILSSSASALCSRQWLEPAVCIIQSGRGLCG